MRGLSLLLGAGLLGAAINAHAVTAFLVRQTSGQSVTGQLMVVCVYQYGGREFQQGMPFGSMCPLNVEVQ